MDDLTQLAEHGRRLAQQHVPPNVLALALAIGIALLVVGVVIAVLGARLVRPVVTIAFALAGVWLALRFASQIDLPVPVTLALVGLLVGSLGYLLHRLWVGLFIAAMSAVVALSVFGYRDILPEVPVFQESHAGASAGGTDLDFALLTPDEQLAYNHPSPETWARDFWAHLSSRHADIRGKMAVIGVGAALAGLLLGLVATRGALIVCTALVGTSLVMSGLSLVVSKTAPEVYASALERPELLAGAWVGLLAASVVIQGLLNRRPPARPVLEPS